jgi:hypothetical protein
MKTKLVLSIITLALIPFYAGAADKKNPELKGESFNWKFAFTEKQINALAKTGYSWGEELIPNGDMQSTVDGFHDIYRWAKPMKIEKNKETGERELVLMQRKDGGAGSHLRVFYKPKYEMKAGDIILAQYRFYTNLSHPRFQPYNGAWVPMEGISAGLLSLDRESPKYKTGFLLFLVTGKNENWANRLHIGANTETEAPRGLRITHWSARRLITKDTDGDGKSDAEEILWTKTSPSQPNKFIKKLTKEKPKTK